MLECGIQFIAMQLNTIIWLRNYALLQCMNFLEAVRQYFCIQD